MTTKPSPSFQRFAGACAILTGVSGFLYAVSFIILARTAPATAGLLSALFLLAGAVLSTPALVALYYRLREADAAFVLWAMVLALAGAAATAMHGGYDLANTINPPAVVNLELPSQTDPRGLFTFGVTGIALLTLSRFILRDGGLPRRLGHLGSLLGLLFLVLYFGRLIVLSPANPVILGPALLSGFLVNPGWYLWLGFSLWRAGTTGK